MGMDCCHRGIKNELVIETDKDNIQDNDGFPQDTDPAFRSKRVEIENQNENIKENVIEEAVNPENNNNEVEVEEVGMNQYEEQNAENNEDNENNENNENNEVNNVEMNLPQIDSNEVQEVNVEINEYNQDKNINEIVNNIQENNEQENNIQENNVQENNIQNEINIDQILKNYNEQQAQQSQNVETEEDYNKYFDQAPTPVNDNNEIDINQYFTNNNFNQTDLNQLGGLNSHFTFGDSQNNGIDLIENNNAPTSQEYNYDYIYENQNA